MTELDVAVFRIKLIGPYGSYASGSECDLTQVYVYGIVRSLGKLCDRCFGCTIIDAICTIYDTGIQEEEGSSGIVSGTEVLTCPGATLGHAFVIVPVRDSGLYVHELSQVLRRH